MQVQCVNDTVHLRLSITADLQGLAFPMVFDLQVHCEKTHCTSKLKSIVFHCPCDSALPPTCRCTVSLTLCTCDSKSHFFASMLVIGHNNIFFLQIQLESPTFNGSRFVSPLRLFHDVTLYLGCLSFVCVVTETRWKCNWRHSQISNWLVEDQLQSCDLWTLSVVTVSLFAASSRSLGPVSVKLQWTFRDN